MVFEKMNKYEEAWNNVRSLSETSDYYKPYNDDKDIKLIGELVEKETPKKPIKDEPSKIRYIPTYVCPSCGQRFSGMISNFCYHCGQKLDWSEQYDQ